MMKRRELIKIIGMSPLLSMAQITDAAASTPQQSLANDVCHLLVYGATPGGVACAVRAARQGLKVILINPTKHLGGMFSSGLGIMDTLYNGARAPIYDEFRQSIYDYYRLKYGKDSTQFESAGPGISKTKYEAKVAEQLINDLLTAEPNITIIKGYYPIKTVRSGRQVKQVTFKAMEGDAILIKEATVFADCSYEADLAVIAGAAYRMGRDSKTEFGEKYAGVIYTRDLDVKEKDKSGMDKDQVTLIGNLNLYRYNEHGTEIFMPESTGEAHPAIQAFNLRAILTDDPANRILPKQPANYDPAYFRDHYSHKIEKLTLSRPNSKTSLNYPKIIGQQNKYVDGNWTVRKEVIRRFYDELLGLLYFRQNDTSLSTEVREHWSKYGLAADEFVDNDYLPYELYVRESRRIKGKTVFTEHDAQLQPGLKRAPIHTDSIGVTEWFLDSHPCTHGKVRNSNEEGEVMLKSETVPGQIPLATIFPSDMDNLIVPVCLSASHIGWGAIRLEPVWMQIGEVAGYIAAEACSRKIAPVAINQDRLIRKLARNRFMISFFNDVEGRESAAWYPAVQYLGTKGFFGSYEVRPHQKLTRAMANRWTAHISVLKEKGNWDAAAQVLKTVKAEEEQADFVTAKLFASMLGKALGKSQQLLGLLKSLDIPDNNFISRGDAARLIFEATGME